MQVARRMEPASRGLLCQGGASCCLALTSVVVKAVGQRGVPVMQIVLIRSLILLAVITAVLASRGKAAAWPWQSERRWLLLLRGFLGFLGISGLYFTVQLLPVTDALVLGLLSPVLVAAASPLVLGEPAGRGVLLALPLCVVGVALVAQPSFLFGGGAAGALSAVGVAVGIAQAACVAASKLTVRLLGQTEPVPTIVFSIAACSAAGAALMCAALPGQWVLPRSPGVWAMLGAAGGLACVVQLLATWALKLSRATPVVLVSYISLVFGLLADLALFHHRPSPLSLLGAALVCASSLLVALLDRRSSSGGSSAAAPAGQLKAKESGSVEVAVAAYWQQPQQRGRREDGAASEAARQAELAEVGGQAAGTQRAGWERSHRHAASSPRPGSRQGGGDEGEEAGDERAPLVRRGSGGT
ncbi:hypothetical protein ABPG75_006322 [Micractinium tetrahymenae]